MRDPHSIEAEHGLLGAMMQRPDLIDTLSEDLSAEAFYFPANADLYRSILAIRSAGQAVMQRVLTGCTARHAGTQHDPTAPVFQQILGGALGEAFRSRHHQSPLMAEPPGPRVLVC